MEGYDYAEKVKDFGNDVKSGKINLAGAVFGLFLIFCLAIGSKALCDRLDVDIPIATQTISK